MIVALLVSTGAAWESAALAALTAHPGVVVLKRCVDVDDLLATASAGQAQVAVLGAELSGLDATVVADLHGHGVRVLAVAADADVARTRAGHLGLDGVLEEDRVDVVADVVTGLMSDAPPTLPAPVATEAMADDGGPAGRVVAVWGPAGAPGRTTIAVALAAELARRRLTTVLLDADPYGGAVAQHLGVLDEVSGLLSAARLVAGGTLAERFPTVQRRLSDRLRLVTGLPRPDRWSEVRPGALAEIVDVARRDGQVVIDTGFSLEHDPAADFGARAQRNGLTLEALEVADDIVVVGSADPVGLARLARAVSDAHDVLAAPRLRVVVNRMRPTLGWREVDVAAMLDGFGSNVGVHFLPDDQAAVDRALVAGRTLLEGGESPLTRAVGALVDAMAGAPAAARSVRR
ncbi:MinD-like ATPase involved in chromosome partitioning or flagellar assembly [Nocardioides thalensis]|uniref:MinD-like ATPase involved in chromosome partitioning or flagellar assembly n=1 Tax=Nocardioides thalensis TaxID=1914755 RepID=A0A853C032_9ACTN|nr:chromosome partitioning protein [Nocardioides thalensis]NYJ00561.1 MinD-like ATPase involved in chromosome partitioning or flagellar assembly [Nocardioides thalensis]